VAAFVDRGSVSEGVAPSVVSQRHPDSGSHSRAQAQRQALMAVKKGKPAGMAGKKQVPPPRKGVGNGK
jgi:hypothetical protein